MGLEELVSSVQVNRRTAGPHPECLTLSFSSDLEAVESWLAETFDGRGPAYAFGSCRAVDREGTVWSVTATLGEPTAEPVPYIVPNPQRVVCVVSQSGMDVTVFDDVDVKRAARFVRAIREKENATIDRSRGRRRRYQQRT